MSDSKKSSKKEREKELRNDGFKRVGGVNYDTIVDRQVGDKRFERERAQKHSDKPINVPVNSTIDALHRMAAGLEGRTIADKISDPNRPTWEQYKKDNESKLDLVDGEARKMVEYRAQLDKEREERLQHGTNRKKTSAISDSEEDSSDSDSDDSNSKRKRKHKKDKKKSKKSKKSKDKKEKKKSSRHHSDNDSDEDSGHQRSDKKKSKADSGDSGGGSYRLSDFMKSAEDN